MTERMEAFVDTKIGTEINVESQVQSNDCTVLRSL